ncbi:MAG TPA: hypothetical protein VK202_01555 [Bacteroidia bacterium]|nr:hypothetical protein [Bacteroidia bacterium]
MHLFKFSAGQFSAPKPATAPSAQTLAVSLKNMSIGEIITLVLTSSLLSAGLTSVVNWYIQKTNYRNDYYKKILDRRIGAYEDVQHLLSLLAGTVQMEDGRPCTLQLALGYDHYIKFQLQIYKAIQNSFWLSERTGEMLTELNVFFLHNIYNAIDENKDFDLQLTELGIQHRDEIKRLHFELENQLYSDFSSMHNIKSFTKPKIRGEARQLYGKPTPLQKQKGNDTTTLQG